MNNQEKMDLDKRFTEYLSKSFIIRPPFFANGWKIPYEGDQETLLREEFDEFHKAEAFAREKQEEVNSKPYFLNQHLGEAASPYYYAITGHGILKSSLHVVWMFREKVDWSQLGLPVSWSDLPGEDEREFAGLDSIYDFRSMEPLMTVNLYLYETDSGCVKCVYVPSAVDEFLHRVGVDDLKTYVRYGGVQYLMK